MIRNSELAATIIGTDGSPASRSEPARSPALQYLRLVTTAIGSEVRMLVALRTRAATNRIRLDPCA